MTINIKKNARTLRLLPLEKKYEMYTVIEIFPEDRISSSSFCFSGYPFELPTIGDEIFALDPFKD